MRINCLWTHYRKPTTNKNNFSEEIHFTFHSLLFYIKENKILHFNDMDAMDAFVNISHVCMCVILKIKKDFKAKVADNYECISIIKSILVKKDIQSIKSIHLYFILFYLILYSSKHYFVYNLSWISCRGNLVNLLLQY